MKNIRRSDDIDSRDYLIVTGNIGKVGLGPSLFNELRLRKISVLEWKVLLTLAYCGPKTIYDISIAQNMRYPAIHKATKNLEELTWVEIVRKEKSKKNITKNIYGLTREGLLWVFSRIPTIPSAMFKSNKQKSSPEPLPEIRNQEDINSHLLEAFDMVSTSQKNTGLFHLFFEHWDFLEELQIADRVFEKIPLAAISTLAEYHCRVPSARGFSSLDLRFTYNLFYEFTLGETINASDRSIGSHYYERLRRMCCESTDLHFRNMMIQILKDVKRDFSEKLCVVKSLLE
jgi:predicted transcriptional regulator